MMMSGDHKMAHISIIAVICDRFVKI